MTWKDFLPQAKKIVDEHRAEAPEGFDPQNTFAVVAIGAGVGIGAGGTWLSAKSADQKRNALMGTTNQWLPNISGDQSGYFSDMNQYLQQASALSRSSAMSDQATQMALREKALPGITAAQQGQVSADAALAQGKLPQGVLDSFMRSGGASSVGSGFGGSGFGFLNQGLFGARGSLGAMQLGSGLLSALLGQAAIPNSPGTASFLQSGVESPGQRTGTQMQVRGQNLGIAQSVAGMPTSSDVWGKWLSSTGGALTGAGMMSSMGGGGFGGGDLTSGGGSPSIGGGAFNTGWGGGAYNAPNMNNVNSLFSNG